MADANSRLDENIAEYLANGERVGQTTFPDLAAHANESERVADEWEAAGYASAAATARADAAEARDIVCRRDHDAALQYARRHCLVGKVKTGFTGFAAERRLNTGFTGFAPGRVPMLRPIRRVPRPRARAPRSQRRPTRVGSRRGPRRSEDDPESALARGAA